MNKQTLYKHTATLVLAFAIGACNTVSPDQYFDITVLNSNLIAGFANNGDFRQMETPSAVLKKDNTIGQQSRIEYVESRIQRIEDTLEKIKALPEDDETRPMKEASLALYEYTLPVYKNEYMALAKKYESGAPKEEVEKDITAIYDQHSKKFDELYTRLTDLGKAYATEHNIKVNWGTH